MNMPNELKEAFAVLSKYQFQPPFENDWGNFSVVNRYKDYKFRLRREKPLTVEEAEKLKEVYTPYIHMSSAMGFVKAAYYAVTHKANILNCVKMNLAYREPEGAVAHAQMWLDMKVEE